MFCSPLCIDHSEPHYKVLDLNHEDDIIIESKKLLGLFLQEYNISGNIWKYVRVTEEVHINCFGKPTTFGIDELFQTLVDLSYLILEENEFYVLRPSDLDEEKEVLIELHYANAETKSVSSMFDVHQDNEIYKYGDVHKLLLYIDVDCEGGELDIYDNSGKYIVNTLTIQSNQIRCILLDGKCYHQPKPILSGHRIMISYQFRRNRNTMKSNEVV
jgi:hypothetical protein